MPSASPRDAVAARRRSRFRADIQGLRAIAVIAVILDHLLHFPGGGFIGVDIFFVISGYLITSHMLRELDRTGRLSLGDFYRRRARRILPAATLVIVATVTLSAVLLPRERGISVAIDGIWAFFFGANWRSLLDGTDYFQLGLPVSPLQHYWSLSVEEQFYFIWPLLTVALFVGGLRLLRSKQGAQRVVIAGFSALLVASFVWSCVQTASAPTEAYFSTFTRAWELGAGALVAAATISGVRLRTAYRIGAAWLGLAGIVAGIILIRPDSLFPGPWAALPVLSTALVIVAGIGASSDYDRALLPITNRASGYVGAISYSLYLWHFPVIILLVALLPDNSLTYVITALAVMTILSVLSYHLVEEPVRRSRWLMPREPDALAARTRRKRAITASAVMLVGAIGAGGITLVALQPAPAATAPPAAVAECFGALSSSAGDPQCAPGPAVAAADLVPSVDALETDTAGGYSCWRAKGEPLRTCEYGSTSDDALRIAVVGDSHAAMVLPALFEVMDERNWHIDSYVGYGCQWRVPDPQSDCGAVINEVTDILSSEESDIDVIVTTAARWASGRDAVDDYREAWSRAIDRGIPVIAIADSPTVTEEALECVSRIGADLAECATPRGEAFDPEDPLVIATEGLEGSAVVETADLYCSASSCPAVIGGVIVYRDTAGHVTGTYMTSAASIVTDRLAVAIDNVLAR